MASVEEELYREQLERQQEQSRRERQKNLAKDVAKDVVKETAKKAVKSAAKKALASEGAAAVTAAVSAALPYILIGLAVIAGIILIVVIITTTIAAVCNQEGLQGSVIRGTSYVASYGIGVDVCEKFSGFGPIVDMVGNVPQVPQNKVCPANIRPPDPNFTIECEDCIDLIQSGIPVKEVNTNSLANRGLVERLSRVISERQNTTFRVTEAFCPVVTHNSINHYNGFAVDIALKPEFSSRGVAEQKELVQRLVEDVISVGFTSVFCEYDPEFSGPRPCGRETTTTGGHIHIEEPNEFN